MVSTSDLGHGLALLQAASVALSNVQPSVPPSTCSSILSSDDQDTQILQQRAQPMPKKTCNSVSALLNPAPADMAAALPPGFVLGKYGKVKKKRGRKPTPGLTDEDRRQARLLKNRRTAETSRRRKVARMNQLAAERDQAKSVTDKLKKHNEYLTQRLAKALGKSLGELLEAEPDVAFRDFENTQSDVSTPDHSESDASAKKS